MDTYIDGAESRSGMAMPRLSGSVTALLRPESPMLAMVVDTIRDHSAPAGYEQMASVRVARVVAIATIADGDGTRLDYLVWHENEMLFLSDLERRPTLSVAIRPADQLLSEQDDLAAKLSVESSYKEAAEHRKTQPIPAKGPRP